MAAAIRVSYLGDHAVQHTVLAINAHTCLDSCMYITTSTRELLSMDHCGVTAAQWEMHTWVCVRASPLDEHTHTHTHTHTKLSLFFKHGPFCPGLTPGGWVDGWMDGWMDGRTPCLVCPQVDGWACVAQRMQASQSLPSMLTSATFPSSALYPQVVCASPL